MEGVRQSYVIKQGNFAWFALNSAFTTIFLASRTKMRVSFFKSSQSLYIPDIFPDLTRSKTNSLPPPKKMPSWKTIDKSFPLLKNGVFLFTGIYQWFSGSKSSFHFSGIYKWFPNLWGFLSPEVVDEPSYASARLVDDEGSSLTTWAANCRTGFRSIQAENTDCNLALVILLMAEILHHLGCIKPCK